MSHLLLFGIYMKKFLFVICFGCVSLLGFSNNVFAIDNLTYSSTSGISCTDNDCYSDGYRYIYVTSNDTGSDSYIGLTVKPIGGGTSQSIRLFTSQAPLVLSVSPDFQYTLVGFQSGATGSITFTDTYPTTIFPNDCPECDDCPPTDQPQVVTDFHNVFMKVLEYSIPVAAIIFVVWFMIDMVTSFIFGRGR